MSDPGDARNPASVMPSPPAQPPHPHPGHHARWLVGTLILGAAVFAGGYWYFQHYQGSVTANVPAPVTVSVGEPPPVFQL